MLIHSKGWSIFFIVVGVVLTLSSGYFLLNELSLWHVLMFAVAIFWLWTGVSNLRRLQKADSKQ